MNQIEILFGLAKGKILPSSTFSKDHLARLISRGQARFVEDKKPEPVEEIETLTPEPGEEIETTSPPKRKRRRRRG